MQKIIKRNQDFMRALFTGKAARHGLTVSVAHPPLPEALGDFAISSRPVRDWIPWFRGHYTAQGRWLREFDDDSVPFINLFTNTGIFAAAFGCPLEKIQGSAACARPIVHSAADAARLREPDCRNAPILARLFEMADALRAEFGPDVPLSPPDIQSPLDIAALIWDKSDFFAAMYEEPEAVAELVNKCSRLLCSFVSAYIRHVGAINTLCYARWYGPGDLGCYVAEDECGSINPEMFERFGMPGLRDLSRAANGLYMHSCANADHQYSLLRTLPNLRGLNRVFSKAQNHSEPRRMLESFAGRTVFMLGSPVQKGMDMLDVAPPGTRFLFAMNFKEINDDARRRYDEMRRRCESYCSDAEKSGIKPPHSKGAPGVSPII